MTDKTAVLGNDSGMTTFSYAGRVIRFRTSRHLLKYTKILQWDNGYLEVMAQYDNSPVEEEEYIDLIPILKNLYMEPQDFLKNIKGVCLHHA